MPTPVKAGACGTDTKKVDFGTKFMSDIMNANTLPWAKGIMEADRAPVHAARTLNPSNSRNNTYGFLSLGMAVQPRNWQAAEPANHEVMNAWLNTLNEDFKGTDSYKPSDLPKIATNLEKAAATLTKNAECLASQAEISPGDANHLKSIAGGMTSAATNLRALHTAVCAGPGIEHVTLDIPARQH